MCSNTEVYDKFEGYTLADCRCTLCQFYKGKKRRCSLSHSECCCAEEKIEALMREYGLRQEVAEQFVTENRGATDEDMSAALFALV